MSAVDYQQMLVTNGMINAGNQYQYIQSQYQMQPSHYGSMRPSDYGGPNSSGELQAGLLNRDPNLDMYYFQENNR